jgi:ABC-type molybdate transport system substrate-binding protein
MKRGTLLAIAFVAALVSSSCSDDKAAAPPSSASKPANLVTVAVAPALERTVASIVDAYRASDPSAQLEVVALDQEALTAAVDDETADIAVLPTPWLDPVRHGLPSGSFGRSLAVIAVPAANPNKIADITPFAPDSGLRTAICAENSAVGNLGSIVATRGGVTVDPAIIGEGCEDDALQQVASGSLDAALMFRPDLRVPEGVTLVVVPPGQNVIVEASYVVIGKSDPTAAFANFLTTDAVHQLLTEHGYLP